MKISNSALLVAALAVTAAVLACSIWLIFRPQRGQGWLRMPKVLGSAILSDTDAEKPEGLPHKYVNGATVRLPILMYHHIGHLPEGADELRKDLTVTPEDFEIQVAWFKGQGYESISLGQLQLFFQGKFTLPEKPVIFTFDDGYEDVFEFGLPILSKYGFSGSVAVITQFAGMNSGSNRYASWQQIKKAASEGVEIVSHTQDHFDGTNPKYDDRFILRNLVDARNELASNLGQETTLLVYPYGHYNGSYAELARKAGYEMALTVNPGKQVSLGNIMEVPRIRVRGLTDIERLKELVLNQ